MPTIVGTAVETDLLGVLQGTLNGDTSILTPSARTFYDPGTSVPGSFRYDAFVTKRGALSVAAPVLVAPNTTQTLTLGSSHEAAQFRAGDACFLVGNAYAGALGAVANTADGPLTVVSTSPVNQTVTVTGRDNTGGPPATSAFAVGASLVVVSASAPGAMVNSASAGAPLNNQVAASLLTSLQGMCGGVIVGQAGTFTTTRFDVAIGAGATPAGVFDELPSLIGGTITFLAGGTLANVGCSARIAASSGAGPVRLDLDNIRDANGDPIAVLPAITAAADTANLVLDLSNGKLAELGEAGGDYTRLVAAALTMHRKLDVVALPAGTAPEIPLINEWNMMGQGTGTMLRMSAAYDNAAGPGGDNALVLEWNDAAGDLPFPLSGTVRVIDAQDGVGSTAWGAAPSGSVFVPYTRTRGSNRLVIGFAALGAVYGTGCIAMLSPNVNGFAKTSGFSPEIPGKYLSGILWQLVEAVENYAVLGT